MGVKKSDFGKNSEFSTEKFWLRFSTTHDLGVEIAMCETELGIEVKVSKKKKAKNFHGAENVCELTAMKISTEIHHNGGS